MVRTICIAVVLACSFALTGWLTLNQSASKESLSIPATGDLVIGEEYPKTLVDAFGWRTTIPKRPRRIVSLALATDEILLDLIDKNRIAAVTRYAVVPGVSNCTTKAQGIAGVIETDLERIVAMQPDLVLVARFSSAALVDALRRCDIPVHRLGRYDTLDDIRRNVLFLGRALGNEKRALRIVRWMDDTLTTVRQRCAEDLQRPRVLYYNQPHTAGAGTIFDELLTVANARNVAAEAGIVGYAAVSKELVVAFDPDVILMNLPPTLMGNASDPRDQLFADAVWNTVSAVRDKRLHLVPSEHLSSISHHVVKAAYDIAWRLHPEQFQHFEPPKFSDSTVSDIAESK